VFKQASFKDPWCIIHRACFESAQPLIQLCSIIVDENYQVAVFQEVCPASQSQTVWQHFSLKD